MTDPCEAISQGLLNRYNFPNSGLNQGQYLLLLAQCGANASLEEIVTQLDSVINLLTQIEANTDELESQLTDIITELQDVNVNLGDVITELQSILTSVQAIDGNTDGIEAQLVTIIALLTSLDTNTDGLEALITASNILLTSIDACCAANNALLTTIDSQLGTLITVLNAIDVTLAAMAADIVLMTASIAQIESDTTSILANQINPSLFGTHTIATGTHAAAPAAGPYSSWVVVKTNAVGAVTVDGITLSAAGDSTSEEAQPQFKVPTPTITLDGGNLGEYEWRTKS